MHEVYEFLMSILNIYIYILNVSNKYKLTFTVY